MKLTTLVLVTGALISASSTPLYADSPAVMLAHKYQPDIAVADYFISEKLDGVRARWTGNELVSRGGHTFAAPQWFTAGFPAITLDGELWSRRGDYQEISSITSRKQPHEGWRQLRFMAFDMPAHGSDFATRVTAMRALPLSPFFAVVPQQKLADDAALANRMDEVIANGGEGLMLHHAAALYQSGRSHELLKLKRFDDAEATVIGYRSGKGKYAGQTGALQLQAGDKIFHVGSGLSDAERRNPPAIGATVTYRYQGFTDAGLPRFAVYLRPRDELDGPK